MNGEKNLDTLLKKLQPKLNSGDFVFCTVASIDEIGMEALLLIFKEAEGTTVIITKETADNLKLNYSFVASWITLKIHSSLEAVGLTAAFLTALTTNGISCNVVAAFYHDHIFVDKKDAAKAMAVLQQLSK